jgi:hypothetical protein
MMLRGTCLATVIALIPAGAARAADTDALKSEVEAALHRFETSTDGRLRWDGADSFEVRPNGDAATATLANVRFSLRKESDDPQPVATITLDRVEVERKPASGGARVDYAFTLPPNSVLTAGDTTITLTLNDGKSTLAVENPGEHRRGTTLSIAGGRIEEKGGKNWATFGRIEANSAVQRGDQGSWREPYSLEMAGFDFRLDEALLTGSVKRIGYAGEAHGQSLEDLDKLRDRLAEFHDVPSGEAERKVRVWLEALPLFLTAFSSAQGEMTIENVSAKEPGGEKLVTLQKATLGGDVGGFDGKAVTFRLTASHEGLDIAPSLVPPNEVPHRAVFDIAIEEISTAALRGLAEAAGHSLPSASDGEKQQAMAQVIATAMSLQPVLRLRQLAVDFKEVGIDASGEARRAPPAPVGYTASGDVRVRGFDALVELIRRRLLRDQLPLLKFIAAPDKAADGSPLDKFHLTSAPGHKLTVNGSDLAAWFDNQGTKPPRTLRLADPPLDGADVRAVQKALPPGGGWTDGVYDTATALAVMRFQKQNGLNIDGAVNDATRDKLGIKPPPAPPAPGPAKPPPKN